LHADFSEESIKELVEALLQKAFVSSGSPPLRWTHTCFWMGRSRLLSNNHLVSNKAAPSSPPVFLHNIVTERHMLFADGLSLPKKNNDTRTCRLYLPRELTLQGSHSLFTNKSHRWCALWKHASSLVFDSVQLPSRTHSSIWAWCVRSRLIWTLQMMQHFLSIFGRHISESKSLFINITLLTCVHMVLYKINLCKHLIWEYSCNDTYLYQSASAVSKTDLRLFTTAANTPLN